MIECDDERNALLSFFRNSRCTVFTFNELIISTTWTTAIVSDCNRKIIDWISSAALGNSEDQKIRNIMSRKLDLLAEDSNCPDVCAIDPIQIEGWAIVNNTYITTRSHASSISFSDPNEGAQQEQTALWLIDSLEPFRAIVNPKLVQFGRSNRELTDLLLSYPLGAFLFESKSLSIFSREKLPERKKLSRNLSKEVKKAARQLKGGIRALREGGSVIDQHGKSVNVERKFPMHAIILVPDLLLLEKAPQFGRGFLEQFLSETGCLLQILDLKELFRMVQAAQILESHTNSVTRMMCFDAHMVERFQAAKNCYNPCFQFLLHLE